MPQNQIAAMKWTLMVLAGLFGGWAVAVTITPTSADYGKLSVGAVVARSFKITRSDTLRTIVSLEGPDPTEFFIRGPEHEMHRGEADTLYGCWNEALQRSLTACDVSVDFRPTSEGIKTATLVVTDFHGQKASATLRGEAGVPDCKPELVPCNWAISYVGGIDLHEVDSVINSDRVARHTTDLSITITQGVVKCDGHYVEFEQNLQDGKPTDEMNFKAVIRGPGLASIEFEPDQNGKMTYTLHYACATPTGTRESKSLRFNSSETETVAAEPADWRNSMIVGESEPATEQGMKLLQGKYQFSEFDPANQEGRRIKACWTLSLKTASPSAAPTGGVTCPP